MRDEFYDRDYQAARSSLNQAVIGLGQDLKLLGQALAAPFISLARINFDAPWASRPKTSKRRAGIA